ncbi:actin-related protein 2/3 complex subunit 2A-like [Chenopodium quinoa]|uniref:actin-related protein 2/3 complex subunit 2A-like n=1 Tax=Chenopodium quinoa TaxID=63459 RepID=UPI000B7900BB|nr:actin-related protein 2/3 complex subunit 2A-like [Chenopodium quinoa]
MPITTPPPRAMFVGGLPSGAIEAIKAAYGTVVKMLDPPKDGFNLTLRLNFSKLSPDESLTMNSLSKYLLRIDLHNLDYDFFTFFLNSKCLIAIRKLKLDNMQELHWTLLTCLILFDLVQEFVEAHRSASAGLNNAPSCQWSPSPPEELAGVPAEALSANAGFVSFVIFPRHVDIKKIDRTVWLLSTFHAYVSYHVKVMFLILKSNFIYFYAPSFHYFAVF